MIKTTSFTVQVLTSVDVEEGHFNPFTVAAERAVDQVLADPMLAVQVSDNDGRHFVYEVSKTDGKARLISFVAE